MAEKKQGSIFSWEEESVMGNWDKDITEIHKKHSESVRAANNVAFGNKQFKQGNGISGDSKTGKLAGTIYFELGAGWSGVNEILADLISMVKDEVINTFSQFEINKNQFDLSEMQFVPAPNDLGDLEEDAIVITFVNGEGTSNIAGMKRNKGTFYVNNNDLDVDYAPHEFGHIFGLSDRYHEGGNFDPDTKNIKSDDFLKITGRLTVPMSEVEDEHSGYDEFTNLMSSNDDENSNPSLTEKQKKIIFSKERENRYNQIFILRVPGKPVPISASEGGESLMNDRGTYTWAKYLGEFLDKNNFFMSNINAQRALDGEITISDEGFTGSRVRNYPRKTGLAKSFKVNQGIVKRATKKRRIKKWGNTLRNVFLR